jgi:hypothetical protein
LNTKPTASAVEARRATMAEYRIKIQNLNASSTINTKVIAAHHGGLESLSVSC